MIILVVFMKVEEMENVFLKLATFLAPGILSLFHHAILWILRY